MTRMGNKEITVKDWFANKVANELGRNITMCLDRFKINSMPHQSVVTEVPRVCSKLEDISEDIKQVRSFGLTVI